MVGGRLPGLHLSSLRVIKSSASGGPHECTPWRPNRRWMYSLEMAPANLLPHRRLPRVKPARVRGKEGLGLRRGPEWKRPGALTTRAVQTQLQARCGRIAPGPLQAPHLLLKRGDSIAPSVALYPLLRVLPPRHATLIAPQHKKKRRIAGGELSKQEDWKQI